MTIEARFYKAQPVSTPVESVALIFEDEFPPTHDLAETQSLQVDDATLLERRLFQTLPGGTYDQLLRAMLERSASRLVVPHAQLVSTV